MRVEPPPGTFTDYPPLNVQPFWFRSKNVRFRLGIPQTIGLFARFIDTRTNTPVDEALDGILADTGHVDFHADDNLLLIASGSTLVIIRWALGDVDVRTVDSVGETGRWWFSSTERDIIAGRSNLTGRAVSINRETREIATIPNIPVGSVAGGITAGVLMLAGTESIGETKSVMTVRWSARRSDPSSSGTEDGPFGFEDWTPSDINASGEFRLENGSRIIAGGATIFGFMVWTDTSTYEITGRTDIFVFAETQVSGRGILGPKTWIVADDRVWWYDHTRTLNVYDGGRPRQVVSPISNAALEMVPDEDVDSLSLSTDLENGEVSLHYPGADGRFRELVYNYREDSWYVFDINRVNITLANGPRSSIGMDGSGRLLFYDLRETLRGFRSDPTLPVPAAPVGQSPFQPAKLPEPFDYFLQTNWMTAPSPSVQSLRARNVVVSYTFARGMTPTDDVDKISLRASSYGLLDLKEAPTEDYQDNPIGQMLYKLRVGGKAVQYTISGEQQRTFLRFGVIDFEGDEGGKK